MQEGKRKGERETEATICRRVGGKERERQRREGQKEGDTEATWRRTHTRGWSGGGQGNWSNWRVSSWAVKLPDKQIAAPTPQYSNPGPT